MIDFISYLVSKICTEAGQFISSDNNNLRVTFSAPSAGILDEIFDRFDALGSRLRLESGENEIWVPVLRVQEGIEDPSHQNSTRCSSNHVVAIRTSYGSYLALSTINSTPLLSTDTTANKLGLNRVNHVAFSTWREEPFIRDVFDAVVNRFRDVPDLVKGLVWKALEEAFIESAQAGDMREPWELLRALYDLGGNGKTSRDLCHFLGIPKLEDGESPEPHINYDIANYMQAHGFTAGTNLLQDDATSKEISEALKLLNQDFVRLYRTPQRFVTRPLGNYAKAGISQSAQWWHVLSQSVWIELLHQEKSKNIGTLKVNCANELFRPTLTSQLAVVKDSPNFLFTIDEELVNEKLLVYRASGRKNLELIKKITLCKLETEWKDDESWPFSHEQYIRYEFICKKQDKPTTLKLVSLDSYLPSVVLNCRSAEKLTPFKKKTVGRGARATVQYECELVTNGTGTQTIELFFRDTVTLPLSIKGQVGEGQNTSIVNWSLTYSEAHKNHALAVIEISEDCQITFEINHPELDDPVKYVINVSANEFTAKGASSEFDRLVINNCTRTENVAKTDVEQSLLTLLEQWILESEESYQPLVIGPGFKESWHLPDWASQPRMSNLHLSLDPRPCADELAPPAGYLKAREQAQRLLKKLCDDKGCTIEALSLGQLMLDKDSREIIDNYVSEYANWLAAPDSLAVWADLITVHRAQQQSHFLESKPLALLLSPFHPVRLAWQCNAQQLMHDSINSGLPCPVAGIIEPYSFPDCMVLKCRDMDGRFNPSGFVAVKSSSDYWSALWRADLISEVTKNNYEGIFGSDLGLKIEGMVNGFNRQQVKRSLNEIRHLYPAKSTLRISLHSDSSGYSSCNDGIDEWCLENLGPDADEWSPANGLTLKIIDKRPRDEQPKPAVLASLTERSGTRVRWYTNSKGDHAVRDLSIVDHLQTMDQTLRKDGVLSPVDPTCASRVSIKKNAAAQRQYLSLSRAGQFVCQHPDDDLQYKSKYKIQLNLSRALELLESACVNEAHFDSLSFAPNLHTLENSLKDTRYSAISSSAVDATCFHSPGKDAYLWDFELPRYAPGAGQASGFYLVAKQSPTMVTAVRNVLKQLPGARDVSDEQVASLLDEVSRRGIPTLKRLTSGGSASLGEVGMLIAARLLQSDFQRGSEGKGLVPAIGNRMVNLVIPADVFQPRFDELRKALGAETRERPDLLVLSIAFDIDAEDELLEPSALKITPIEVKARSTEMTERQRDEALTQARSFAGFLRSLKERGDESPLWGIAYRDLIASWLDYGFRVYGETAVAQATPHWVHYHQQTIARLMSNELKVELDPDGRLISIENTAKSRVIYTGKSPIKNTAVLGLELAGALLTGNQPQVVADMVKQVGNWGLLAFNCVVAKDKSEGTSQDLENKKNTHGLAVKPSEFSENPSKLNRSILQRDKVDSAINEPEIISSEPTIGLNFKIGRTKDLIGSKEVIFHPGNTELNNINIGVVGDLGTGKTQLLKSLVYQMVKQPEQNRGVSPKVLILDYKRDFSDKEDSCQFINKAKVKVVSPYKIPLNLFSTEGDNSSRAILDKFGFFRDILRKIFSVNAPVQDKYLKEAIKAAYQNTRNEEGRDPTIYDVLVQYESIVEKPDSVTGIISDMVDYEIFENNPTKIISFDEFFDGVVAIDLKDLSDEKLKRMVVVIFLNLYFDYMLKVKKQPFLGENPQTRFIDSYLLVDEAHNIMPYEFEVLTKLLVQGRAFGVGVILASQYFSHFKTTRTDYLEPIGSWFIHRVPGLTARDLDKVGLPTASDSMVKRISSLEMFNSLCKTLDWGGEFIEEIPFYQLD